mmetsp:Transcript_46293/g.107693  ORF Transcript_46293/g.107693 Transcript_46293/m.107693 type:complete len:224 (-) Transcript_46293:1271-1942(-)
MPTFWSLFCGATSSAASSFTSFCFKLLFGDSFSSPSSSGSVRISSRTSLMCRITLLSPLMMIPLTCLNMRNVTNECVKSAKGQGPIPYKASQTKPCQVMYVHSGTKHATTKAPALTFSKGSSPHDCQTLGGTTSAISSSSSDSSLSSSDSSAGAAAAALGLLILVALCLLSVVVTCAGVSATATFFKSRPRTAGIQILRARNATAISTIRSKTRDQRVQAATG